MRKLDRPNRRFDWLLMISAPTVVPVSKISIEPPGPPRLKFVTLPVGVLPALAK
ncbi:hypothetical protein D3C81_872990 [compost metagenome]